MHNHGTNTLILTVFNQIWLLLYNEPDVNYGIVRMAHQPSVSSYCFSSIAARGWLLFRTLSLSFCWIGLSDPIITTLLLLQTAVPSSLSDTPPEHIVSVWGQTLVSSCCPMLWLRNCAHASQFSHTVPLVFPIRGQDSVLSLPPLILDMLFLPEQFRKLLFGAVIK